MSRANTPCPPSGARDQHRFSSCQPLPASANRHPHSWCQAGQAGSALGQVGPQPAGYVGKSSPWFSALAHAACRRWPTKRLWCGSCSVVERQVRAGVGVAWARQSEAAPLLMMSPCASCAFLNVVASRLRSPRMKSTRMPQPSCGGGIRFVPTAYQWCADIRPGEIDVARRCWWICLKPRCCVPWFGHPAHSRETAWWPQFLLYARHWPPTLIVLRGSPTNIQGRSWRW